MLNIERTERGSRQHFKYKFLRYQNHICPANALAMAHNSCFTQDTYHTFLRFLKQIIARKKATSYVCDLVQVQRVIELFGKQVNNALNVH